MIPFVKMHGLGNDFVVIDGRNGAVSIDPAAARAIADRKLGVGCDQLIVIEPPRNSGAAFMRIRNADGGEVDACGNAARCVADLLMAEQGADRVAFETNGGLMDARAAGENLVTVDIGPARLAWDEIPLARESDTLHLDIALGPLADPAAVNVGNPHMVFFVDDAETVDLPVLGPELEHHALYPERTNVETATVRPDGSIRMRVWERGVGITRACGTGACATLVAAARRGLTGREAVVELDGGPLAVRWRDDGHVDMTGPVATSFTGAIDERLLP